jgi:hypothetical protein
MEISHVKINMEIEMFSCVLLFLISIDKTWYIKFEVFQKNYCMSKGLSSHYNQFFNNPFVTPIDTSFLRFLKLTFYAINALLFIINFGALILLFQKYNHNF